MAVHPLPLVKTLEVPGFAYYTPAPFAPLPRTRPATPAVDSAQSRAAEALAVMYGYYAAAE